MSDNPSPFVGTCECGHEQIIGYSDQPEPIVLRDKQCEQCGSQIRKLAVTFHETVTMHDSASLAIIPAKRTGKHRVRREIQVGSFPKRDGSEEWVDKYLDRDRDSNTYVEIINGEEIRNKKLSEHKGHGVNEKPPKP